MCDAIQIAHAQIASDEKHVFSLAIGKPLSLLWNLRKMTQKLLRKFCDVGPWCEIQGRGKTSLTQVQARREPWSTRLAFGDIHSKSAEKDFSMELRKTCLVLAQMFAFEALQLPLWTETLPNLKGAQTMKCTLWTEIPEFSRLKVPNSRFALHGLGPPKFTVCAPFFSSNSRFMRLFQGALDTPLDSPFSATLSVHGLHFTVCAPLKNLSMHFKIERCEMPALRFGLSLQSGLRCDSLQCQIASDTGRATKDGPQGSSPPNGNFVPPFCYTTPHL